jgi:hypothetical protein
MGVELRNNVILGMPASGKSTFIAALSYILFSDEVETILQSSLTSDEGYISELQKRWLLYQELKHTPTAGQTWITFNLSARDSSLSMSIELPDFSGESLKNAVVTGIYPEELANALKKSEGVFLFTSAAGKEDDVLLSEYFSFLADEDGNSDEDFEEGLQSPDNSKGDLVSSSTSQDVAEPGKSEEEKKPAEKLFDPMEMPEQVKTLQLLQTVNEFERKRRKLVIMVSAWDIVSPDGTGVAPADWLEQNRPMLWQYLNFNADLWNVRIYGVSAQGGRLPDDKAELAKLVKPSERVKLFGHGAAKHDLTEPLYWMAT